MKVKEKINKIIENRLIMRLLWIACLILFLVLFFRHIKFKQSRLYYNKGVEKFKEENYPEAEDYFSYSLLYRQPKRLECRERINYALSITTPITEDSVTEDNLDEQIERLNDARDILTAHDCAHSNDSKGHNRKAQRLKEEIDAYIEYLQEKHAKPDEEPEGEEDEGEESNDSEAEKEKAEKEEAQKKEEEAKLKEQFNQIEQQGISERTTNLEKYREWMRDDVYYSGKSW